MRLFKLSRNADRDNFAFRYKCDYQEICMISCMRYTYFNNTGRDATRAKDERRKTEDLTEMIRIMFNTMRRSSVNYGRSIYIYINIERSRPTWLSIAEIV